MRVIAGLLFLLLQITVWFVILPFRILLWILLCFVELGAILFGTRPRTGGPRQQK